MAEPILSCTAAMRQHSLEKSLFSTSVTQGQTKTEAIDAAAAVPFTQFNTTSTHTPAEPNIDV